jgi:5-formyltetrahydrofolate cyclo-ligase
MRSWTEPYAPARGFVAVTPPAALGHDAPVEPDVRSTEAVRKRTLRAELRQARARRRAAADDEGWHEVAVGVAAAVLADPDVQRSCELARPVAAYASFGDEPPTGALLDALVAAGAPVLLPVVRAGRVLAWARYDGVGSLVPDAFGIPTPTGVPLGTGAAALEAAGVRVVLVPATAVSPAGARIGQGGGFYDVLLADLPAVADGGALRLAIVFADEVRDDLPVEPHDARIDRTVVLAEPS